jgi:hypothetical protein
MLVESKLDSVKRFFTMKANEEALHLTLPRFMQAPHALHALSIERAVKAREFQPREGFKLICRFN